MNNRSLASQVLLERINTSLGLALGENTAEAAKVLLEIAKQRERLTSLLPNDSEGIYRMAHEFFAKTPPLLKSD